MKDFIFTVLPCGLYGKYRSMFNDVVHISTVKTSFVMKSNSRLCTSSGCATFRDYEYGIDIPLEEFDEELVAEINTLSSTEYSFVVKDITVTVVDNTINRAYPNLEVISVVDRSYKTLTVEFGLRYVGATELFDFFHEQYDNVSFDGYVLTFNNVTDASPVFQRLVEFFEYTKCGMLITNEVRLVYSSGWWETVYKMLGIDHE